MLHLEEVGYSFIPVLFLIIFFMLLYVLIILKNFFIWMLRKIADVNLVSFL